jgi:hypothetical protein
MSGDNSEYDLIPVPETHNTLTCMLIAALTSERLQERTIPYRLDTFIDQIHN